MGSTEIPSSYLHPIQEEIDRSIIFHPQYEGPYSPWAPNPTSQHELEFCSGSAVYNYESSIDTKSFFSNSEASHLTTQATAGLERIETYVGRDGNVQLAHERSEFPDTNQVKLEPVEGNYLDQEQEIWERDDIDVMLPHLQRNESGSSLRGYSHTHGSQSDMRRSSLQPTSHSAAFIKPEPEPISNQNMLFEEPTNYPKYSWPSSPEPQSQSRRSSSTSPLTTPTQSQSDKHSTSPSSTSLPSISVTCTNCNTQMTPLWRRNPAGATLCNACGLYLKLHGTTRPLSLKTDVIKRRKRSSCSGAGNGGLSSERVVGVNEERARV